MWGGGGHLETCSGARGAGGHRTFPPAASRKKVKHIQPALPLTVCPSDSLSGVRMCPSTVPPPPPPLPPLWSNSSRGPSLSLS